MPSQEYVRFVLELLALTDRMGCHEELLWHRNRDHKTVGDEPIKFMMDCSDTFDWGSADGEPINIERMPLFRQAVEDVSQAIGGRDAEQGWYVTVVYCGRIKGRKPIHQYYRKECQHLWPLFDSCADAQQTVS